MSSAKQITHTHTHTHTLSLSRFVSHMHIYIYTKNPNHVSQKKNTKTGCRALVKTLKSSQSSQNCMPCVVRSSESQISKTRPNGPPKIVVFNYLLANNSSKRTIRDPNFTALIAAPDCAAASKRPARGASLRRDRLRKPVPQR